MCNFSRRRDWWPASGVLAIGAAALLKITTQGDASNAEASVIFAVSMGLLAWCVVTFAVRQRRLQKRRGADPGIKSGDDRPARNGLG